MFPSEQPSRNSHPVPLGFESRSPDLAERQRLIRTCGPWLAFSGVVLLVHTVAAVSYVQTAISKQPDVKKSVVAVVCPSEIRNEQAAIDLQFQATTVLPQAGADFKLAIERGGEWLSPFETVLHLDDKHRTAQIRIPVARRPSLRGAEIFLNVSPSKPDAVKVTPTSSFMTTLAPLKAQEPSLQTTLLVSAPASLAYSTDRFDVTVKIRNPAVAQKYFIRINVDRNGEKLLSPLMREVELSAAHSDETVTYRLLSRPTSTQAVTIEFASADSKLRTQAQIQIQPPLSPSISPPVDLVVSSPGNVASDKWDVGQTLSVAGLTESRAVRVEHDSPQFLSPTAQSVELTAEKPSGNLTWKVLKHPVGDHHEVKFKATADWIKPVRPWSLTLDPTLPKSKGDQALLVVIDTQLIGAERAPWFPQVIKQTITPYHDRLRGAAPLVLRKGKAPEFWDGTATFGDAGAYSADDASDAFAQLTELLKQDQTDEGLVIVIWANGFAPPGDSSLSYPLQKKRHFTLLWLDVQNVQDLGLFQEWQDQSVRDDFELKFLFAPKDLLKNNLATLLRPASR